MSRRNFIFNILSPVIRYRQIFAGTLSHSQLENVKLEFRRGDTTKFMILRRNEFEISILAYFKNILSVTISSISVDSSNFLSNLKAYSVFVLTNPIILFALICRMMDFFFFEIYDTIREI